MNHWMEGRKNMRKRQIESMQYQNLHLIAEKSGQHDFQNTVLVGVPTLIWSLTILALLGCNDLSNVQNHGDRTLGNVSSIEKTSSEVDISSQEVVVDFGDVDELKVERTLTLNNPFESEVSLDTKSNASCGCVKASSLSGIVSQGERAVVLVSLNAFGKSGAVSEKVRLHWLSNEGKLVIEQDVRVVAKVSKNFAIEPTAIYLDEATEKASVYVESRFPLVNDTLKIDGLVQGLEAHRLPEKYGFELKLDEATFNEASPVQLTISARLVGNEAPVVGICHVSVTKRSRLEVRPSRLRCIPSENGVFSSEVILLCPEFSNELDPIEMKGLGVSGFRGVSLEKLSDRLFRFKFVFESTQLKEVGNSINVQFDVGGWNAKSQLVFEN